MLAGAFRSLRMMMMIKVKKTAASTVCIFRIAPDGSCVGFDDNDAEKFPQRHRHR